MVDDRYPVSVDVSDLTYADLFGISYDEYLSDPLKHAEAQLHGQKWVLEHIETDVSSVGVHPRLGAAPSAFGAPLYRTKGSRAWVKPWIDTAKDLEALAKIDPEQTGIEVTIAEWKKQYETMADRYPVAFLDGDVFFPLAGQSLPLVHAAEDPLTLAADLMGSDRFFMRCIEDPAFVDELLALLTHKLAAIICKNQDMANYDGPFFVSSDYAPMLPPDLYARFAVPALQRIKEVIRGPMRLHHCVFPMQSVDIILTDIRPEILNGFKVQGEVGPAMAAIAERVGNQAYLEPYLDGTVMLHQSEEQIYADAYVTIRAFDTAGCRFHLGAMSCDQHPVDDLLKLNAVMRAARDWGRGLGLGRKA